MEHEHTNTLQCVRVLLEESASFDQPEGGRHLLIGKARFRGPLVPADMLLAVIVSASPPPLARLSPLTLASVPASQTAGRTGENVQNPNERSVRVVNFVSIHICS